MEEAVSPGGVFPEEFDWERFLRLTAFHGATSFLLQSLRPRPGGPAPPEVLDRLRSGLFQDVQWRAHLTKELLRILRCFQSAGIGVLAYKGPALSQFLYGDPTARCFSDLDLVVREEEFPRAGELLRQEGYRSPCDSLTDRQRRVTFRCTCHEQFLCRDDGRGAWCVELHWGLTPPDFSMEVCPEELWVRSQGILVQGQEIRIHGTEDLLLLLCLHGSKHLWRRIWWLCDVADLVRTHPGLDWKALEGRAQVLGIRRVFFLGLRLASDLLRLELPEGILSRVLNDRESGLLAARIQQKLLRAEGNLNERWETRRFYWGVRERFRDRARDALGYAASLLTPTSLEWDRWPLPDSLFWMYYPLRVGRLSAKYLGRSYAEGEI